MHVLAVASEPTIFWDGTDAASIVGRIKVPTGAGRLEAAEQEMNGPSGRAHEEHFLGHPSGLGVRTPGSAIWSRTLPQRRSDASSPARARAARRGSSGFAP